LYSCRADTRSPLKRAKGEKRGKTKFRPSELVLVSRSQCGAEMMTGKFYKGAVDLKTEAQTQLMRVLM
jgi:hypothetical protein